MPGRGAVVALVLSVASCGDAPRATLPGPSADSPPAAEPAAAHAGHPVVFSAKDSTGGAASAEATSRAADVVRSRIAAMRFEGCTVESRTGAVVLWVTDPSEPRLAVLRDLATSPGTVEFRVCADASLRRASDPEQPAPAGYRWVPAAEHEPGGPFLLEAPETSEPEEGREARIRSRVFTDEDLAPASDAAVRIGGQWVVNFRLQEDRSLEFHDFTAAILRRQLAIVLDGRILSMPVVMAALPGQGLISGGGASGFSEEEARRLSAVLGHGRLPCRLVPAEPAATPR